MLIMRCVSQSIAPGFFGSAMKTDFNMSRRITRQQVVGTVSARACPLAVGHAHYTSGGSHLLRDPLQLSLEPLGTSFRGVSRGDTAEVLTRSVVKPVGKGLQTLPFFSL